MYLYQCKKAAALCGSCVGFSKAEYQCGWCEDTTSCSVSDGCPAEPWIEPGGECPGNPEIKSVRNFVIIYYIVMFVYMLVYYI